MLGGTKREGEEEKDNRDDCKHGEEERYGDFEKKSLVFAGR